MRVGEHFSCAAAIFAIVRWTLSASDREIRTEELDEGVGGKEFIHESFVVGGV